MCCDSILFIAYWHLCLLLIAYVQIAIIVLIIVIMNVNIIIIMSLSFQKYRYLIIFISILTSQRDHLCTNSCKLLYGLINLKTGNYAESLQSCQQVSTCRTFDLLIVYDYCTTMRFFFIQFLIYFSIRFISKIDFADISLYLFYL